MRIRTLCLLPAALTALSILSITLAAVPPNRAGARPKAVRNTTTAAPADQREALYQIAPIRALMQGVYDGAMTIGELRRHGDFGLGTLNGLDGEMLAFDGRFYQIRSNGKAYPVPPGAKTPFAAVTFFEPDLTFAVRGPLDLAALERHIDRRLPSKNLFYAVRIEGTFGAVVTRSVPRQERPYRSLKAVIRTQPTFAFRGVKGTLVGFRCPEYIGVVSVPGYHFHFLTADRRAGGHVLSLNLQNLQSVRVRVDVTPRLVLDLPRDAGFHGADLRAQTGSDLQEAEKGPPDTPR